VAEEDGAVAEAGDAGGVDVEILAGREDGAADQAGVARDLADADGDHHVLQAGAEDGDDDEGHQDAGEGEHDVDHAHHGGVHELAVVARQQAEDHADGGGDGDRDQADRERDAGAVEDAGEDVAAELVGAQPMLGGGWLGAVGRVDLDRIVGGEEGGGEGRRDDEQEQDEADDRPPVLAEEVGEAAAAAAGRGRFRAQQRPRRGKGLLHGGSASWEPVGCP
jgi:hypothetical protein